MKLFARVVLATLVLFSQMGLGAVACACPTTSNPQSLNPAPTSKACPVSGERNCKCCKSEGSPNENHSTDHKISSKSTECKITSSQVTTSDTWVGVQVVPDSVAIQPAAIEVVSYGSVAVCAHPAHLVVPRIRPPNTTANGLRAPPAR